VEYLLGPTPEHVHLGTNGPGHEIMYGEGGVVVPADFVEGFAAAITGLLNDDTVRATMGARAHEITIPYFTWPRMTSALLDDLGVSPHHPDESGVQA
jgi:glycosyltransferase involved in cell wall biosynthesis